MSSFGKAFGTFFGATLGAGLGMGITNAAFGANSPFLPFGNVFANGGCFPTDCCYGGHQFSQMDRMLDQAYMHGRVDQARADRMQLAAFVYGRGAWA